MMHNSIRPHDAEANHRWLMDRKRNYTSQCGEDGILEAIFEVIGEAEKWCVDFGAQDGRQNSNSYHLINARGWSAILIEPDRKSFQALQTCHANNTRVTLLNQAVDFAGENRLDNLLARTGVPKNFSMLNIDVDGNDYHVWEAIEVYRPRVVVIECNPTIPCDVEFVQARDWRVNHGNSLLSIYQLGKKKGYDLVAATELNAIFVLAELFPKFAIPDNHPRTLRPSSVYESRIFHLYDGTVILEGNQSITWHSLQLGKQGLQAVPKFFRTFPPLMSPLKKFLWTLYRRLRAL